MFSDARSKRVAVVAHCILNQNSISDGTADFPCRFAEVLEILAENDIGVIQLPCPELTCLGLDRGDPHGGERALLEENSRIRDLMSCEDHAEKLAKLADGVVYQLSEYARHGFEIVGLIGINRSPSCGVETTTKGGEKSPVEECSWIC